MTHGDDDGLRLPPAIAPKQIVVVPMLRDKPEDAEVLKYCEELVAALNKLTAFGQPLRALLDTKKIKSAEKRWNWVRRGAPIIVEDRPARCRGRPGHLYAARRSARRRQGQIHRQAARGFPGRRVQLLAEIQAGLYAEAKARLDGNIKSGVTDWEGVEDYFAGSDEEFKGWLRVPGQSRAARRWKRWSQAEGAEAHHPQRAAGPAGAVRRPASSPARRAWKRF